MNRLKNESSLYLRSHAYNPVDWYPWGPEALLRSKNENKIIFLSIGYSTCHWCHVMEHQSFEDETVAKNLTESFISIKVDREERPDLDHLYMTFLQAMTGHGGWPMSVFLTPDLKPFFAGTYYPRDTFLDLLQRVQQTWKKNPAAILKSASDVVEAIVKDQKIDQPNFDTADDGVLQKSYLKIKDTWLAQIDASFDHEWGGLGSAPKFPISFSLLALLEFAEPTEMQKEYVRKTYWGMFRGGIMDWVEGGFYRYSTDRTWHIPHFEKMLYDQAFHIEAILHVLQVMRGSDNDDDMLLQVTETMLLKTVEYVLNELQLNGGGFAAAEDADSYHEGLQAKQEGYYYTFDLGELQQALGDLANGFDLESSAAQEDLAGQIHLQANRKLEAKEYLAFLKNFEKLGGFEKLKTLRKKRKRPDKDTKLITAWNGWILAALARASALKNQRSWFHAARTGLEFIRQNLFADGFLYRMWCDGKIKQRGFAEDYAALIRASLTVAEVCPLFLENGQPWFDWAIQLQDQMDRLFFDSKTNRYFQTDGEDASVLLRIYEDYDGVTPTSTSESCLNLIQLGFGTKNLHDQARFLKSAKNIMASHLSQLESTPRARTEMFRALGRWMMGAQIHWLGTFGSQNVEQENLKRYFADTLPTWLLKYEPTPRTPSQPTISFCRGMVCERSFKSVSELLDAMRPNT